MPNIRSYFKNYFYNRENILVRALVFLGCCSASVIMPRSRPLRQLLWQHYDDKNHYQTAQLIYFLISCRFGRPVMIHHYDVFLEKRQVFEAIRLYEKLGVDTSDKKVLLLTGLACLYALMNETKKAAELLKKARDTHIKIRARISKKAIHGMVELRDALQAEGIRLFLCSGTLLAAIRDEDFIPGDMDIDLGVFASEASMERLKEVISGVKNFGIIHSRSKNGCLRLEHKLGVGVDIFIHEKEGNKIWHGNDVTRWWNSSFELKKHSFLGESFFIPRDYEKYLNENYADYKKRSLFFSTLVDTPNMSFSKSPKALSYLMLIYGHKSFEKRDRYESEFVADKLNKLFNVKL